jgi:hypothetical protein
MRSAWRLASADKRERNRAKFGCWGWQERHGAVVAARAWISTTFDGENKHLTGSTEHGNGLGRCHDARGQRLEWREDDRVDQRCNVTDGQVRPDPDFPAPSPLFEPGSFPSDVQVRPAVCERVCAPVRWVVEQTTVTRVRTNDGASNALALCKRPGHRDPTLQTVLLRHRSSQE